MIGCPNREVARGLGMVENEIPSHQVETVNAALEREATLESQLHDKTEQIRDLSAKVTDS